MESKENSQVVEGTGGGPGLYVFGKEERNEINEVSESGYLYRYGDADNPKFRKKVYTLEKEFANYSGVKYSVATCSGTSALFIALKALGIGPGDEVIVPAYTFVASYSAIIFAGAMPVLAEIDESFTLDPEDIEKRITKNTKAIMPVHMLGNPSNMDAICSVAKKHGLYVVEDSCQAAGAMYKGKKVGALGDMGAFSLNLYKTITSGDGGLVITNDENLYQRAFAIHDQGHSPNRMGTSEVGTRSIIGFNFRINELTGAIALAQLRKLEKMVEKLRQNKIKMKNTLEGLEGFSYRKLNDSEGECGTLLTLIFPTKEKAGSVAAKLGTKTMDNSGWHVYYNMEHILKHLKDNGVNIGKGSFPKTDDILERSLNITIGVICAGIQAVFGININSSEEEIREKALLLRKVIADN